MGNSRWELPNHLQSRPHCYLSPLRVYSIEDFGEIWWWVDYSAEDALAAHIKLNYTDANVKLIVGEFPTILDVSEEMPFNMLEVDDVVHSAELWCQINGRGLLASTCH